MFSDLSSRVWAIIIAQLLTALFHSIGFFVKPKPRNETEKQLLDLMANYRMDMGGGIKRSYKNLFIGVSICFTIIYILGAVLNWYFLRSGISTEVWKGFLLIQLVLYGAVFLFQLRLTFWPPIIVTGLVFIFLIIANIFTL